VSVKKGLKEQGKNVPKSKIPVKNVLDSLDACPMPPMDPGKNAFAIEDMLEMVLFAAELILTPVADAPKHLLTAFKENVNVKIPECVLMAENALIEMNVFRE